MNVRIRTLRLSAVAAIATAAVAAAPAAATQDSSAAPWVATLDCGKGPVKVTSGNDMWSPLVAVRSGRKYYPVAWNVRAGGKTVRARKPGSRKRRTMKCSYADQAAKGTVTVLKRTG